MASSVPWAIIGGRLDVVYLCQIFYSLRWDRLWLNAVLKLLGTNLMYVGDFRKSQLLILLVSRDKVGDKRIRVLRDRRMRMRTCQSESLAFH
jgi:hypothetical protein